MSERIVDYNRFKEAIKIKKNEKQTQIKNSYFEYLKIKSKNEKKIDEMFIEDYEDEMKGIAEFMNTTIKQILGEWRREYKSITKDMILKKEIKRRIKELILQKYDETIILDWLEIEFSDKISDSVSKRDYLKKIYEDFLNGDKLWNRY